MIMITTILSVAFIIFAAIVVLMGVLKAKKHYWVEYVSKLIITVFSAFFAAWLTSVLSVKLSNPILASINSSSKITWLNGILSNLPSSKKVLGALIAFAISGILFFIIYIILKAALKAIFTKPLTKLFLVIAGAITKKNYIAKAYPKGVKKAKKDKKEAVNYGKENFIKAAIFGALCAFVSYIIILVPIVASLEFTANMTTLALPEGIPTEISEKLPKALSDFPDALVDNVGSKTVMTIGGRQIHNIYASVSVDGEKINFSNEMAVAVDIVKGVAAITDKDLSSEEKGDAIRSTTDHIDNATISSPATYANALAVGSVDNSVVYTSYFSLADDTTIFYMQSVEYLYGYIYYSLEILAGKILEYVMIDGLGEYEDQQFSRSVCADIVGADLPGDGKHLAGEKIDLV